MTCLHCDKELERKHRKGPSPKWCSSACRHRAMRRHRHPERFSARPCIECGKPFIPGIKCTTRTKACSDKCLRRYIYKSQKVALNAYRNQWSKDHRDLQRSYVKKCRAAKPDLYREQKRRDENRRRSIKAGCSEHYTIQEWNELLDKTGHHCLCCGATGVKLTVDHVVALSRGGADTISNIQPLCRKCNTAKNAKTIDYRPLAMGR